MGIKPLDILGQKIVAAELCELDNHVSQLTICRNALVVICASSRSCKHLPAMRSPVEAQTLLPLEGL